MGLNQPKIESNWTEYENNSFTVTITNSERAFPAVRKQTSSYSPIPVHSGGSEWEVPFPTR